MDIGSQTRVIIVEKENLTLIDPPVRPAAPREPHRARRMLLSDEDAPMTRKPPD